MAEAGLWNSPSDFWQLGQQEKGHYPTRCKTLRGFAPQQLRSLGERREEKGYVDTTICTKYRALGERQKGFSDCSNKKPLPMPVCRLSAIRVVDTCLRHRCTNVREASKTNQSLKTTASSALMPVPLVARLICVPPSANS
jgi:hypothetical protein